MNKKWEDDAKCCELTWWRKKLKELGSDRFIKYRRGYFEAMLKMFGDKFKPSGNVVNIGTGAMSIFSFIKVKKAIEVDPAIGNYLEEYKMLPWPDFKYYKSTKPLGDEYADTVICMNTIDHTSEPLEMVSEIFRILKNGGKLYFEVNFDRYDSPAHYQKFSAELVKKLFKVGFKFTYTNIKTDCGPLKNWDEYYAIMEKEK